MKKVTWDSPVFQNPNSPFVGKSFKQLWENGQKLEREYEDAQAYLKKALPAMVALLEIKLRDKEPLVVMRPLRYQTSEIVKGDAIDDAFYNRNKDEKPNDKFTDVIKTIMPGTKLILKSLDFALSEFIFQDQNGEEHALNFAERDNLLTQTNVYEETKKFFESIGE